MRAIRALRRSSLTGESHARQRVASAAHNVTQSKSEKRNGRERVACRDVLEESTATTVDAGRLSAATDDVPGLLRVVYPWPTCVWLWLRLDSRQAGPSRRFFNYLLGSSWREKGGGQDLKSMSSKIIYVSESSLDIFIAVL
ncbi:hypothetical protein GWI33_001195 [Rhynchophorus ferrugineus]|uniref:Uncharacterized protein n=1 Tax=Rhynchophorus ferrugineus TaxID=354439 RepID=A0A834ILG0_RHYFE|nr:hypothetical protein GWI33_001195 [Rhynchophorus ferrugineus]